MYLQQQPSPGQRSAPDASGLHAEPIGKEMRAERVLQGGHSPCPPHLPPQWASVPWQHYPGRHTSLAPKRHAQTWEGKRCTVLIKTIFTLLWASLYHSLLFTQHSRWEIGISHLSMGNKYFSERKIIPGDVELRLLDEVVQPPESTKVPVGVAVVEMLLLINRVVTGCSIWEEWVQKSKANVLCGISYIY